MAKTAGKKKGTARRKPPPVKKKVTRKAAGAEPPLEVEFGEVEFLREFSGTEQAMIRDHWNDSKLGADKTPAKSLTDTEFARGIFEAQRVGLEPLLDQIFPVKYWGRKGGSDGKGGFSAATWLTTIEVYRLVADRTDTYRPGATATLYEYYGGEEPAKKGRCCKRTGLVAVTVFVQKLVAGTWVEYGETAHWDEYADLYDDGNGKNLWGSKPRTMLAKCAEAKTLRRGFPRELGKLYVGEEMELAPREHSGEQGVAVPAPAPAELGEIKTGEAAEEAVGHGRQKPDQGEQEAPPAPAAPEEAQEQPPAENGGEEAAEATVETEESLAEIRARLVKYAAIESKQKTEGHIRFLIGARCMLMAGGEHKRAEDLLFLISEYDGKGFRSAKTIQGKTLRVVYGKVKTAFGEWEESGLAPDEEVPDGKLPLEEAEEPEKKEGSPEAEVLAKIAGGSAPVTAYRAAAMEAAGLEGWDDSLWEKILEGWDDHFIDALGRYPNDQNWEDGKSSKVATTPRSYVAAWTKAGGPKDSAVALGELSRLTGIGIENLTPAHYALGIEKAGIAVLGLVAKFKERTAKDD